jgi:hypothetical protein
MIKKKEKLFYEFGELRLTKWDKLNWAIEQLETVEDKTTKQKKKKWKILGYYGNIETAINKLPVKFINKTDVETLTELQKAICEFRNDVLFEIKRIGVI